MAKSSVKNAGKKMSKMEFEARAVIGKLRRGSSLTRNDQLRCIGSIGKSLQKYGLNSIRDIKPSHVERYFAELRDIPRCWGNSKHYKAVSGLLGLAPLLLL